MWSFAFAVWLLPALGPPLLFGVSRAGPLVTVALILVLLLGADAYPGRAGDRESTQGIEPICLDGFRLTARRSTGGRAT